MLEIKTVGLSYIEQAKQFERLCFPTDFWKDEDWAELLADERAVYYALMKEDEIIGDVFIYNWKGEKDYVKIMNVAIHPDYRGLGFAHLLLDHVTMKMRALGMARFCGETRQSNKAMQKVFEDCGYVLDRIEENYYTNPDESACKYVLKF